MTVRDSEDALDAFWVSNADLNVRLAAEAGGRVQGFSFGENSSNGIEGSLAGNLPQLVQIIDDHTVELAVN